MNIVSIQQDGFTIIIDEDDYQKIKHLQLAVKRQHDNLPYVLVNGMLRQRLLHRMLMGCSLFNDNRSVDHIDGNPLNNSRSNLRFATYSLNQLNKGKPNTKPCTSKSKYKGVCWAKDRGKWKAYIAYRHKSVHLYMGDSEEDAAYAYNIGARLVAGAFAKFNEGIPNDFISEKQEINIYVRRNLARFKLIP